MKEGDVSSVSEGVADRGEALLQQQPPPLPKKKRSLPGMPDPDAEVIALSPKTLLATNRFVCEICSKGFQRDQNLQLHRRGHNLPWRLKQRSVDDEPPRKRVYVCPEVSCVHHSPSRALGDLTGIKKHFCRKHGEKKWKCERCSKKYAVISDWKAHSKTCGTREYRCDCGTLFSRRDSFITHRAFCDALAQESARTKQNLSVASDNGCAIASSSALPPIQPLTPSTTVVSPALPVLNSEVADNDMGVSTPAPLSTGAAAVTNVISSAAKPMVLAKSSPPTSSFAAVFHPASSSSPEYAQTNMVCSSTSTSCPASIFTLCPTEPLPSLSLSPSLYLSTNCPSGFQSHDHGQRQLHVASPTPPSMSATALLQKAAQMGATTPNSSFLRGFGLQTSSSSPRQPNSEQWDVKSEANALSPGLGLAHSSSEVVISSPLFSNKPTLDLLGLGMSAGSSFLTPNSYAGGVGRSPSAEEFWNGIMGKSNRPP